MKFKHGIFLGFFSGFALGALAENRANKHMEKNGEKEVEGLLSRISAYKEGWLSGKNWFLVYHKIHHPDCDKCPH
jgi:hypothetical protein